MAKIEDADGRLRPGIADQQPRLRMAFAGASCKLRTFAFNSPHWGHMNSYIADFVRLIRLPALLLAGPFGCYAAYYVLFVGRFIDGSEYPYLTDMYDDPVGMALGIGGFIIALVGSLFPLSRWHNGGFSPTRKALPLVVLAAVVVGIGMLIALSVYRVLGTILPSYLIANYALYQFYATDGAAWMVLACYAAIYLLLADMYFGGVRLANSATFLFAIVIVSISGGRGILVMFVLAWALLLLLQRVKFWQLVIAAAFAAIVVGGSFVAVTHLRYSTGWSVTAANASAAPDQVDVTATGSYQELNFNAAFILNDTLRGLGSGAVRPGPYALEDAANRLVPRYINPNKPTSMAETRALYPHVAERGSNITFPLQANLMLHIGPRGFWLDWIIVLAGQLIFLWGCFRRAAATRLLAFAAFMFGSTFALVARGGIFNARLLDQAVCLLVAYIAYLCLVWGHQKLMRFHVGWQTSA